MFNNFPVSHDSCYDSETATTAAKWNLTTINCIVGITVACQVTVDVVCLREKGLIQSKTFQEAIFQLSNSCNHRFQST